MYFAFLFLDFIYIYIVFNMSHFVLQSVDGKNNITKLYHSTLFIIQSNQASSPKHISLRQWMHFNAAHSIYFNLTFISITLAKQSMLGEKIHTFAEWNAFDFTHPPSFYLSFVAQFCKAYQMHGGWSGQPGRGVLLPRSGTLAWKRQPSQQLAWSRAR